VRGINKITGKSKFWTQAHPLTKKQNDLWEELVPSSGKALTEHGELLRMISRLVYDIFDNALGNDRRKEIEYIQKHRMEYGSFLVDQMSPIVLANLMSAQNAPSEDENLLMKYIPTGIIADQLFCDRLDDIIQAITQYCIKQTEASKIKVEWVKKFGNEVDAVEARVDEQIQITIYNGAIQGGGGIGGTIAEARQLLECYSRAIALYEKGMQKS
jgi:hypothetical protein